MKKQYIVIRDNNGNNNIWEIIAEFDRNYWINTRDMNVVISKEFVEQPVNGSSLFTYKGVVDIENIVISEFMDCSNCLYCDKCPDACKVIKCDWDLDCEDDRLDGEIDRVVLSVYDY